jgi:hypothetical protein
MTGGLPAWVMKLVNPDKLPQNHPASSFGFAARCFLG